MKREKSEVDWSHLLGKFQRDGKHTCSANISYFLNCHMRLHNSNIVWNKNREVVSIRFSSLC